MTLLHKYYDWQLIENLPLSALDGLLSFAQKKEIESRTFPLWLANFAVCKMKGTESISFDNFLAAIEQSVDGKPEKESGRSGEEILAEFTHIIEAQRDREEV